MKKLVCFCLAVVLTMVVFAGFGNQSVKADKTVGAIDGNLWMANESQKPFTNDLSSFSTTDQNGNSVTQDIFKDKDITMVNIWATWCGPCVGEMGELQKLYEMLKKMSNVNMITICEDLAEQPELVKKILDENGCMFITIRPDDSIKNNLFNEVQYFPTTIFVDKDGKIIGEPIIGVFGDEIAENYMKQIKKILEQIKK